MAIEITRGLVRVAAQRLARLTGEKDFVVIGRGTLAITAPRKFRSMAMSDDLDMWPEKDEMAALDESIESLGEGSQFHQQQGFYIERVGAWTLLTQPEGWKDRAHRIQFGDVSVLVLGLLDLAYNKIEANRVKDREFIREALSNGLLSIGEVEAFIQTQAPTPEVARTLRARLRRLAKNQSA